MDTRHTRLHDQYFEEPIVSQLDNMRATARARRKITFDCLNAIVVDASVRCKKGHFFKRPGIEKGNGSATLLTILKGRSPQVCGKCLDFDWEVAE